LISLGFAVQDFLVHRQCLQVIVRSLLGIQGNCVTDLAPVPPKISGLLHQFITANGIGYPNRNPFCLGELLLRKTTTILVA
jgi:hypothetical protein